MIGFVSCFTMNKFGGSDNNNNIIEPGHLAEILQNSVAGARVLIVDCRRFLDYNMSHIQNSINICCSKLVRRRLQENKMSAAELLYQQWLGLVGDEAEKQAKKQCPNVDVVLYDEKSDAQTTKPSATTMNATTQTNGICRKKSSADDISFIAVMMDKLCCNANFNSVRSLKGGFVDFQARYPELCESQTTPCVPIQQQGPKFSLASLSQPCLPACNQGPTKILPFLYLGSLQDAMDPETLKKYGVTYILNMSVGCPKPDFIQDEHFLRIPVNDNYSEKILPHFERAFDFLNKVREANGVALVHCLAGISRSPTLAIAYVMSYLHMEQEEAYRYVKEKRPSISPNFNFLGQLLEYEKQLKTQRHRELFAEQKCHLLQEFIRPMAPAHRKIANVVTPDTLVQATNFNTNNGPPTSAAESFKRSFSCPVKIQKGPNRETLNLEVMDFSPANEINVNGKRRMKTKTTLSSLVACTSTSTTSSGSIPSGGARCLPTVREDLPSPSTELSKLSFEVDSAFPFSPPMSIVGSWSSSDDCNLNDSQKCFDGCLADDKLQTDEDCKSSVGNPFFDRLLPEEGSGFNLLRRSRSEFHQTKDDSIKKIQMKPLTAFPALCVENPLFNAVTARRNIQRCQNPNLHITTAHPVDDFIKHCSAVPFVEQQDDEQQPRCRPKHLIWTSLTQRFRHLLNNKRASWPNILPYLDDFDEGSTAAALMLATMDTDAAGPLSPNTAHNISKLLGPTKSKSESAMMYKLCGSDNDEPVKKKSSGFSTDLDSPESGFHSGILLSDATSSSSRGRRDGDRDSLGSTSSLEIAAVS